MMNLFGKKVNGYKSITAFAKELRHRHFEYWKIPYSFQLRETIKLKGFILAYLLRSEFLVII